MTTFIAFLRGINVGGGNMLPMKELVQICETTGFKNVRTYINSGNVIFESKLSEAAARKKLEDALQVSRGRKIEVALRTKEELEAVFAKNPYPKLEPSRVMVLFLSTQLPEDYLKDFKHEGPEKITTGGREVYVYYPEGMGRSKLKLPKTAETGTMRNMNTVARLIKMT